MSPAQCRPAGRPSCLLYAVLHMPLREKQSPPAARQPPHHWRPPLCFVVLSPNLRRPDSSPRACLPITPTVSQQAAMLTQWPIAYWATIAICLRWGLRWVQRLLQGPALRPPPPLLNLLLPGFGDWLCQLYKDFTIHVVMPHGVTGPYQLQSEGGQGESSSLGGYLCIGRLWHAFLVGLLPQGARPRDFALRSSQRWHLLHPSGTHSSLAAGRAQRRWKVACPDCCWPACLSWLSLPHGHCTHNHRPTLPIAPMAFP